MRRNTVITEQDVTRRRPRMPDIVIVRLPQIRVDAGAPRSRPHPCVWRPRIRLA
jgi:hypothetical protein